MDLLKTNLCFCIYVSEAQLVVWNRCSCGVVMAHERTRFMSLLTGVSI
jgi:hypothetical protein